jgi:preprotein translocase subunit SecG
MKPAAAFLVIVTAVVVVVFVLIAIFGDCGETYPSGDSRNEIR